jgi:hypothetical protein
LTQQLFLAGNLKSQSAQWRVECPCRNQQDEKERQKIERLSQTHEFLSILNGKVA